MSVPTAAANGESIGESAIRSDNPDSPALSLWDRVLLPKHARYDPDTFVFSPFLNILFGVTCTFTAAQIYYNQPLLLTLSEQFNVSNSKISNIPTLAQAGYATGLLLIAPMGDICKRRQVVLVLLACSPVLTIATACVKSFQAMLALSFLLGFVSVVPQMIMPLVGDLAPPDKRASSISIVLSGLILGVIFARVLAGVIAEFADWRSVYWMSTGLVSAILILSWSMFPNVPAKNPNLAYYQIHSTMAKLLYTQPLLVHAAAISFIQSANFSGFWVTLTFLLGEEYHFSQLNIGLFSLIGLAGVGMAPIIGRLIDGLVPWTGVCIGLVIAIATQAMETAAGGISLAAPAICCVTLDLGQQLVMVSNTTRIYGIDANLRARINAVNVISSFCGQVFGSSVCSIIYTRYGWRAGAAFSLGMVCFNLLLLMTRGPHSNKWWGWDGGNNLRKRTAAKQGEEAGVTSESEK